MKNKQTDQEESREGLDSPGNITNTTNGMIESSGIGLKT